MTDQTTAPETGAGVTEERPAISPAEADRAAAEAAGGFAERPEVYVGAAFAGGLLIAIVLRRLGR